MKKGMFFIAMIVFSQLLFAQSEKYSGAMKKNIGMLDSAFQRGNFGELSNNFERIGDAEKTEWLPYYYAAYCTVMSAFTSDKSKSDAMADKASEQLTKAEALAGKPNSETHIIRSMIASAHMMVDPQARWMQYGAASSENIALAKGLDSTNPRALYLEGQAKFYTPENFGGGKIPAKALFEKALIRFDAFKPQTELHPTWGKSSTQYFLSLCN